MLRPPHRAIRAVVAALAVLSLLPACAAGGRSEGPAAPDPSGYRTVVERRVGEAALVVEVVESPTGMAATWSARAPERRLLAEEVRIGTDVWVHLAMTEVDRITEPAWIHVDLTQRWQRDFLDANALGLLDQRLLWRADPGDDVDGEAVVGVDRLSATERVLRLEGGGAVRVTRQRLRPPPRVAPPDSLPVVPLRDIEDVLVRP